MITKRNIIRTCRRLGHFEAAPYNDGTLRSAYHVRELEVYRLLQLKDPLDIFLSHDWPNNIISFGNRDQLLKRKPHLRYAWRIGGTTYTSPMISSN